MALRHTTRNTNKISLLLHVSSLLLHIAHVFHVHVAGEFVFQLFHFLLNAVLQTLRDIDHPQKYISLSPLRPVLLVVVVIINGDIFVSIRSASMFNPHFSVFRPAT